MRDTFLTLDAFYEWLGKLDCAEVVGQTGNPMNCPLQKWLNVYAIGYAYIWCTREDEINKVGIRLPYPLFQFRQEFDKQGFQKTMSAAETRILVEDLMKNGEKRENADL